MISMKIFCCLESETQFKYGLIQSIQSMKTFTRYKNNSVDSEHPKYKN